MASTGRPVVVVHGGAGRVPEARRPAHAEGCRRAADAGLACLLDGADRLVAAVEAVRLLEDDPRFNAGTGACLTEAGTLELDASVMEGTDLRAGAVAVLPPFPNPVRIALEALRDGHHAFYAGPGASAFAQARGFHPATPGEMVTEAARERLAMVLAGRVGEREWAGGTVGAVVADGRGHVAAATSTGGTVGKRVGRVGDTPIVGAGTWADDRSGACSTTGVGEDILRFNLARHACELLRSDPDAQRAAERAIAAFGDRIAGRGGLILVGADGDVGIARSTETMSYAVATVGEATRLGF